MMYRDDLPNRVRAVILGGGIHGVAVLHDLVSRGWRDVILLERHQLGAGASCRTLKYAPLLPGSSEAWTMADARALANEAPRIAQLAPDLCTHEFCHWHLADPWRRWCARAVALIAGSNRHSRLAADGLQIAGYKFDDLGLVHRIAQSAKMLGAMIREDCRVDRLEMDENGWRLNGTEANNKSFSLGALYVINCTGQDANVLLERSGIYPGYNPTYINEIYLVLAAETFERAMVWRAANNYPGFNFAIPWHGMVMVGPWRIESDRPHEVFSKELIQKAVRRLSDELPRLGLDQNAVIDGFIRRRLFADTAGSSLLSWAPRTLIGEMHGKRGSLFTLYGGVFLGFRQYAREIGDRVMRRFGERRPSLADTVQAWMSPDLDTVDDIALRFGKGGIASDHLI